MPKKKKFDPDVCPHCNGRNTNLLEKNTHECYDCGATYKLTYDKVAPSKAIDRVSVIKRRDQINISDGNMIRESELYKRIVDKIPKAQFHKIILAIKADLKKENA